jgi:hypothetical protein
VIGLAVGGGVLLASRGLAVFPGSEPVLKRCQAVSRSFVPDGLIGVILILKITESRAQVALVSGSVSVVSGLISILHRHRAGAIKRFPVR